MSCPELELLSAFVDGALDATAATDVERHLSTCSSCREHAGEMRWLDTLGRSSLGTIRVSARRNPVLPGAGPTCLQFFLPRALAAAAAGLIFCSVAAWWISDRYREQSRVAAPTQGTVSGADRSPSMEMGGPMHGAAFGYSSDEAFERWVQPFRRLRIPLVPMEDLANFDKGKAAEPAPTKRDGAG